MGRENIPTKEEFEKLAAAGKLTRQQVDALVALTESGYCYHRSWGFGKIVSTDTVFGRLIIDFQGKAGHPMDMAFAADFLKPISSDHIYARKVSDMDNLRQMAALHHLDLIKLVLKSFGNRATIDQIQQVLVPDVIKDDWKKWWEGAKRELKKDGHFQVPVKKSEPIIYQVKEVSLQNRLMEEFRAAKGLKARGTVAHEILKNLSDLSDKAGMAKEVIPALNAEIVTHQRTQPSTALEAIFVRDELRQATDSAASEGELEAQAIWAQEAGKIGSLLEQIPAAKHRRALESFKASNPDRWPEALLGALEPSLGKGRRGNRARADLRRKTGPVEGAIGALYQPTPGEQRSASLAGTRTFGQLCGHPRPGGFSRHADRDGTGPIQRETLEQTSRLYFGRSDPAGGIDRLGGFGSHQRFADPERCNFPPVSTTWINAHCWRAL